MQQITGRYKLLSHGTYSPENIYVSTSDYLRGELYYGADGFLSVLIVFSKNPTQAKDVYGYVGRYSVKSPSVVEHQMSVASHPSQMDATEERTFKHEGSNIILGKIYPDGTRFEAVWTLLS